MESFDAITHARVWALDHQEALDSQWKGMQ